MMSKMLVLVMMAAATAAENKDATHAWKWTSDGHSQCQPAVDVEDDGVVVKKNTCMGGNRFISIGGVARCAHVDDVSKNCIIPDCPGSDGASGKVCKMMTPGGSASGGVGAEGLPASPASGGMRDTELFNGMRGWKDMPKSQFLGFPETMKYRRALVPTVRTKAGFNMQLHCSKYTSGADDLCDHFVFVYSCPPCQFENGGDSFIPSLLNMGFVPHRCQVVFDLDKTVDSALHNVVVYHKQTLQNLVDEIVNPKLLEFVWYSTSPATTVCPSITDEADCNNSAECGWNNDACVASFCPKPKKTHKPPLGPWKETPKCQVCPHSDSEKDFIPPLDMSMPR